MEIHETQYLSSRSWHDIDFIERLNEEAREKWRLVMIMMMMMMTTTSMMVMIVEDDQSDDVIV